MHLFTLPHIESFAYPWLLLLSLLVLLSLWLFTRYPKLFTPSFRFPTTHLASCAKNSTNPTAQDKLSTHIKHRLSLRTLVRILTIFSSTLGGLLLVVALARPYGPAIYENISEGIDIYLALDMSGSMRAYDYSQSEIQDKINANQHVNSRFDMAIEQLQSFVRARQTQCQASDSTPRCDRIGMVSFAKHAFLEFPLTTDYNVILKILAQRRLGDIDASFTCIGDAIARAVAGLRHSSAHSKVLILITDGTQRGGRVSIAQALEAAALYDVSIFPILVGSAAQSYINTGSETHWTLKKVDFPTNFPVLEYIAKSTHAQAFKAQNDAELNTQLHHILNNFESSQHTDSWDVNHADLSLFFVFWAFICLTFSLLMRFLLIKPYP